MERDVVVIDVRADAGAGVWAALADGSSYYIKCNLAHRQRRCAGDGVRLGCAALVARKMRIATERALVLISSPSHVAHLSEAPPAARRRLRAHCSAGGC